MTKPKTKSKVVTTEEEILIDEVETGDEDLKDRKANKFFNFFKDEQNFTITLYRIPNNGRGKRELIDKFENEIPDMLSIRTAWGGGKYELYAHDFDSKLLDTCQINVAELPEGVKPLIESKNENEDEVINKLIKMRALFSDNGGNNEIMLKMMEMQNSFSQQVTSMIAGINEKSLMQQIESEKRFSQMLEKMNSGKNTMTELVETIQVIDTIRGDGGGDSSLVEKVLSNPAVQNIAAGFIASQGETSQPIQQPIQQVVEKPKKLSDSFPEDFLNKLTMETRQKAIDIIVEKAGKSVEDSTLIIDQLLREKGLM